MNKKNYCNYYKKEMECKNCEQFEAFITDCEKTNNGWCCGFLCEKCKDYMAQDKELKKDKLYLLEIEYGCEREDSSMFMAKSLLVGYVVGTEERFFFMAVFMIKTITEIMLVEIR